MISSMREMAQEVLAETGNKDAVVSVLAEFFQDSFKEDPAGVGDWLDRNGTSVDLFVEMVAELRSPQASEVPHE